MLMRMLLKSKYFTSRPTTVRCAALINLQSLKIRLQCTDYVVHSTIQLFSVLCSYCFMSFCVMRDVLCDENVASVFIICNAVSKIASEILNKVGSYFILDHQLHVCYF